MARLSIDRARPRLVLAPTDAPDDRSTDPARHDPGDARAGKRGEPAGEQGTSPAHATLEQMEREIKQYGISSWKWYCHTDPGRTGNGFQLDDDNAQWSRIL